MLRRASRVSLVIFLVECLSGCSTSRFVGVRLQPGESLEFFVPLCGDDQLRSVQLDAVTSDEPTQRETLWRVAAEGTEVSTGRVEVPIEALSAARPGDQLLVLASTDSDRLVTSFTLADLPTDGSALKKGGGTDKKMSVAELEHSQQEDCAGSRVKNSALLAARISVVAVALGGIVWFGLHRRPRADGFVLPGDRYW